MAPAYGPALIFLYHQRRPNAGFSHLFLAGTRAMVGRENGTYNRQGGTAWLTRFRKATSNVPAAVEVPATMGYEPAASDERRPMGGDRGADYASLEIEKVRRQALVSRSRRNSACRISSIPWRRISPVRTLPPLAQNPGIHRRSDCFFREDDSGFSPYTPRRTCLPGASWPCTPPPYLV